MKPEIPEEIRERINDLHKLGSFNFKEIADQVGVSASTVAYIVRKPEAVKANTALARFHQMEKKANSLRPPDEILGDAPPVALVQQYRAARTQLDIYMAILGSEALRRENPE